jgi:Flp pilus assembly secretin CpaC
LTSSNISVDVASDTITLNGTAPSQKDRDEAKRIAQSFAGSRKVVDNVKVSGSGAGSSSDMSSTPNSSTSSQGSSTSTQNPEQPSTPKQ